jgi:transcriptional regulator with XRE-family HTH domain
MSDFALDRLALLARARPNLLASGIARYQEQEGLDDRQLAARLGCEVEALARLALCERPRPAPYFARDAERIAHYIHADFRQLVQILRAIEAREALSGTPGTKSTIGPRLLAARDYDEEEEDRENQENEEVTYTDIENEAGNG